MPRYRRSHAASAMFFFTVTLADRRASTLVEHIESLRAAYATVLQSRPFRTIAICILPDHLYAIWEPPPGDAGYSMRWSHLKSIFTRGLPAAQERSLSKWVKRERGIWQRRFWKHRIRDEADLRRHIDDIHYNPVRHGLVSRLVDWPCSSFHQYVRHGLLPADWSGDAIDDGDRYGE